MLLTLRSKKAKPAPVASLTAPETNALKSRHPSGSSPLDTERFLRSIDEAQAIILFSKHGDIQYANQNFLAVTGYRMEEIQGRHHRIFVDSDYANSDEYRKFWNDLAAGKFQSGEFRRMDKKGKEIWISASYCPVRNERGEVVQVVKTATDITRQKATQLDIQNRTLAVIEFNVDGTIRHANQLFLDTVGYSLNEIRGKHHRIFMPSGEMTEGEYADFWRSLGSGRYIQGEFRRMSKAGKEIWLQGAYSPVLDHDGRVVSVVKSVNDITSEVLAKKKAGQIGTMIARSVSEMSTAIREISERIANTADKAATSEADAERANGSVNDLLESSAEIDRVVGLIQDLAEQTNLLALNATIEAARAGDAGRGFAVVAAEVKALATATAQATQDIAASVNSIQSNIDSVVSAIGSISRSAAEVSTNTNSIAASVEEQSLLMESLGTNSDELLALTERDA